MPQHMTGGRERPLWSLSRDGELVMIASEGKCWRYLHQTHCYSVHHACEYEGYELKRIEEGEKDESHN